MRENKYPLTIAAKIDVETRDYIEQVAKINHVSMGEVVRDLVYEGMKARTKEIENDQEPE
jgi:hypothetical protein